MATFDLSALTKLQNANKTNIKPTAKEKQNVPAKSLTERAAGSVAATAAKPAQPTATAPVAPTPPEPVINPATSATSAPVPADDVAAFAAALEELEQLIDADNPIRDATMQIIERCQAAPHLADFLYENEDAFAIGLRALRKLHSQRTEKRGAYREKQQKKQESVNVFLADLGDLKL